MKKLIFLLTIICSLNCLAQFKKIDSTAISQRTLESLKYHQPIHHSPKFKVTVRTAFSMTNVQQVLDNGFSTDIFDDIQINQLVKYNGRIRWRFKNKNKIYFGLQTMADVMPGRKPNTYYIGFVKNF
jgi:hypothetical protein